MCAYLTKHVAYIIYIYIMNICIYIILPSLQMAAFMHSYEQSGKEGVSNFISWGHSVIK